MIEAAAAGVHYEDQLASEKKCGHLGGKVLVPTSQFIRTLVAARLAADMLDVPTVIMARTDSLRVLLTSDIDEREPPFITGERTAEGFFHVREGSMPRSRALAYAPYADMLWFETSTPTSARRASSPGDQRALPGQGADVQLLAVIQLAPPPGGVRTSRPSRSSSREWATGTSSSHSPASTRERVDVRARLGLREDEGMAAYVKLQGPRVRSGGAGLLVARSARLPGDVIGARRTSKVIFAIEEAVNRWRERGPEDCVDAVAKGIRVLQPN